MLKMKKYILSAFMGVAALTSCYDFLRVHPEHQVNENSFYKSPKDFEIALVGTYAGLQRLHNTAIVILGELTTDNADIKWTSPTVSETECDEMNPTASNEFLNTVWSVW